MLKKISIALVFVFVLTLFGITPVLAVPAGGNSMITTDTPTNFAGGYRGDYGGYSGFRFTAGANVTVKTLGRVDVGDGAGSPMAYNHDLVIWDVAKNKIIAKTTVTPSSQKENGFCYENLSAPVFLIKGKEYTIASSEIINGDHWFGFFDMTNIHTDVALGAKAIHYGPGYVDDANQPDWMPYEDGNHNPPESYGFVGLNFWYEETPAVGSSLITTDTPVPGSAGYRDNYGGYSGFRFTAGANVTVTKLGRVNVGDDQGNPMAYDHDLVIWDVAKNEIIAKTTVTPSSQKENGFCYETLSAPVSLIKGKEYTIASAEIFANPGEGIYGDAWFGYFDMTGIHTNVAAGARAIHYGPGYVDDANQPDWMPYEDGTHNNPESYGFVGLNFWYEETSAGGNSMITTDNPTASSGGYRGNYGGYSGFRFTAGANVTVTTLGRVNVGDDQGNPMAYSHDLVIWDVAENKIIAKVTVTPFSKKENGFCYENLSAPVALIEGKEYTIASSEIDITTGAYGDYWCGFFDMTDIHTDVALGAKAIHGPGHIDEVNQPTWMPYEDGNHNPPESYGFVGLNFWYDDIGNDSLMTTPIPSNLKTSIRADYEGYSGFRFTAAENITLTTLGRADVIANHPMAYNHKVVIWDVAENKIIAKVTVTPSSPINGDYRYENLLKPVTLLAGREYSLVSEELIGGDYWLVHYDLTGMHSSAITGIKLLTGNNELDNVNQPGWVIDGWDNYGFVGLNFWYDEAVLDYDQLLTDITAMLLNPATKKLYADQNGDGEITIVDLLLVKQKTLEENITLATAPDSSYARNKLIEYSSDVVNANGKRYDSKDSMNNWMDGAKIIENPAVPGQFIAIYHGYDLPSLVNGINSNSYRIICIATSTDLLNWTYVTTLAGSSGNSATQATIKAVGTAFVAMWEQEPENHLKAAYYNSWADLAAGNSSKQYKFSRQLSQNAEGTPNIYSATETTLDIGFHYYYQKKYDRNARGTLTNWTGTNTGEWSVSVQDSINNAILATGIISDRNIGDRDDVSLGRFDFLIMEGGGNNKNFGGWRSFIYDPSNTTAYQLNIVTDGGSLAFANPTATVVTLNGRKAIVNTLFIPSQNSVPGEAGTCIYYHYIDHL